MLVTYLGGHQTKAHACHQMRHMLFAVLGISVNPFDAQLPHVILLTRVQLIVANNVVEVIQVQVEYVRIAGSHIRKVPQRIIARLLV